MNFSSDDANSPMKKLILAGGLLFSFSFFADAQQSPPVQKAIKDQNRKANEAKADKVVSDSTKKQINTPATPGSTQKKKSCCTKNCCSNKKKSS